MERMHQPSRQILEGAHSKDLAQTVILVMVILPVTRMLMAPMQPFLSQILAEVP
jgi:hypothetical protein